MKELDEDLKEICERCEQKKSYKETLCPFRSIDNDYCDNILNLQENLGVMVEPKNYEIKIFTTNGWLYGSLYNTLTLIDRDNAKELGSQRIEAIDYVKSKNKKDLVLHITSRDKTTIYNVENGNINISEVFTSSTTSFSITISIFFNIEDEKAKSLKELAEFILGKTL